MLLLCACLQAGGGIWRRGVAGCLVHRDIQSYTLCGIQGQHPLRVSDLMALQAAVGADFLQIHGLPLRRPFACLVQQTRSLWMA